MAVIDELMKTAIEMKEALLAAYDPEAIISVFVSVKFLTPNGS